MIFYACASMKFGCLSMPKNKIVNKLHFMDEISISGMNLFHPKIS
jgi:hypothetical protein